MADTSTDGGRGAWRWLVLIAANAGIFLLLLSLIEGVAGLALFGWRLYRRPWAQAEIHHTRHDPDLGWSNVPGIVLPDMYGPGRALRINRQGFRADEEYSRSPPPGMVRLICSGDSFTFGHGVGNEATWCRLLETEMPGVQTLNMGQAAYGIDQAYLWYKRDGERFSHAVHLFAFIEDDLRRMSVATGKPVLRLRSGQIVVDNVPVPEPRWRWLRAQARVLTELDAYQVLMALRRRLDLLPAAASPPSSELLEAVLVDLRKLNEQRGSMLAVVRLPSVDDGRSSELIEFAAAAERQHEIYFDLGREYAQLEPEQQAALFLGATDPYPGGANHYSVAGNRWAARTIAARVRANPQLSARLP